MQGMSGNKEMYFWFYISTYIFSMSKLKHRQVPGRPGRCGAQRGGGARPGQADQGAESPGNVPFCLPKMPDIIAVNDISKTRTKAILRKPVEERSHSRFIFPGHALHEKCLQRQIAVGTRVSSQERRALFVLLINRG